MFEWRSLLYGALAIILVPFFVWVLGSVLGWFGGVVLPNVTVPTMMFVAYFGQVFTLMFGQYYLSMFLTILFAFAVIRMIMRFISNRGNIVESEVSDILVGDEVHTVTSSKTYSPYGRVKYRGKNVRKKPYSPDSFSDTSYSYSTIGNKHFRTKVTMYEKNGLAYSKTNRAVFPNRLKRGE
jgi:membrane protein implicated in regulation of membrane protease activity